MNIFVSSLFKSGTWMIRDIIQGMTGRRPMEPDRIVGLPDYGNLNMIDFSPDSFFSWHTEINEATKGFLIAHEVKCILVVRNIFDLTVSAYHHLAGEVDTDIGANAKQSDFLAQFNEPEGLALVISGYRSGDWRFPGIAPEVRNMRNMLQFSKEYPVLMTSYERLVIMKEPELQRIANYLEVTLSQEECQRLALGNQFDSMKNKALGSVGSSHFR